MSDMLSVQNFAGPRGGGQVAVGAKGSFGFRTSGPDGRSVGGYIPGVAGGVVAEGPGGAFAGGFIPGLIGGAVARGPEGGRGGLLYIPGVGLGAGFVNPNNGNYGGLLWGSGGVVVRGNINGQTINYSA